MPEELPRFVREYQFFQTRHRKLQKSMYSVRLARDHPSIPPFEWEDQGKRYVAYFVTTVSDDGVTFRFHFSRNGIPVTFQPVLNSYKRFLVREENQNICSLC